MTCLSFTNTAHTPARAHTQQSTAHAPAIRADTCQQHLDTCQQQPDDLLAPPAAVDLPTGSVVALPDLAAGIDAIRFLISPVLRINVHVHENGT